MKKNSFLIFLLGASLFLVLDACRPDKEDENPLTTYNRNTLISNVVDQYVVKGYSAYRAKLNSLKTATSNFNNSPNEANLLLIQEAWKAALEEWQKVSFLGFGPALDYALTAQSNTYPVDTLEIKSNLNSGSYNLGTIANYDAKGLQALDYIFFKSGMTASQLVVELQDAKVKSYVLAVIEDLISQVSAVENSWASYAATFKSLNSSNAEGSAISLMINGLSKGIEEDIRRGKIGIPAGVFNGYSQQIMPERVEAYHSDWSLKSAEASVKALKNYFEGFNYEGTSNGEGIYDYLVHVKTKKEGALLADLISNQISSCLSKIQAINSPLRTAVSTDHASVMAAYNELQKLVSLVKIDLTAALGVQITYQDTDGD